MEVDRLELLIEAEAKGAVAQIQRLEAELLRLKSSLKTMGATGSLTGIGGTAASTSAIINSQKAIGRSTNSLMGQFSKLAFGFFALRRVIQFGMKSIRSSMDFSETVNLFQTVFRKIGLDAGDEFEFAFLEKATDFNKRLSEALSLDPNMVMNYQATFAQMSNSMGLVADSAYNISESFTALGADWASLRNMEIPDVMIKLQSALAGQIRPARQLGVDISKTTLSTLALKYGITESIEKMDQATKVQLRFLGVMQQSTVAMGDMARTIDSPANQLRILEQQWDLLSRSIGNTFLPIVSHIMPYLNGIVIALRNIIQTVAVFFGWEMPDWTSSEIYSGVTDLGGDFDDVTDSVEGTTNATNKLKRSLLGIDQINKLSSNTSSSGTIGVGSTGYAALDAAIAAETEAYMAKIQEDIDNMSNSANEFAEKIEDKMRKVLITVGLIAAGIIAWKVSVGFMASLNTISAFMGVGGAGGVLFGGAGAVGASGTAGALSSLAFGFFAIAAGLTLIYENYKTAKSFFEKLNEINNGKTAESFRNIWQTIFKSFTSDFKDAKDKSDYYAAEQASNIIKAAVETKEQAIEAARVQYQGVKDEAAKLYGVGTPEYNEMVRLAEEARDKSISAAETQFSSVRDKAIEGLGAASVWIDHTTGEMLAKQQDFGKSWKSAFEEMFNIKVPSIFEKIVKWLSDLAGKSITVDAKSTVSGVSHGEQLKTKYMFGSTLPSFSGYYADAGFPTPGEMFIAREPGNPELVGSVGGKTAVMNNNQIVSAVSQGVASAVKSVMGGGGGDIHIKIVNADGTVTGEQIISAAQRYNQRFGETIIQAG